MFDPSAVLLELRTLLFCGADASGGGATRSTRDTRTLLGQRACHEVRETFSRELAVAAATPVALGMNHQQTATSESRDQARANSLELFAAEGVASDGVPAQGDSAAHLVHVLAARSGRPARQLFQLLARDDESSGDAQSHLEICPGQGSERIARRGGAARSELLRRIRRVNEVRHEFQLYKQAVAVAI